MTIRTESRITVAAAVSDVWAYIADVARWSEWAPTVLECRIQGGGTLQPGAWVEQRAKDLGFNHRRREQVTAVDAPNSMAFAGTMGTSVARWGMEFEPAGEAHTDGHIDARTEAHTDEHTDEHTNVMMWVEVDLANVMRAIPGRALQRQVQRVSDIEMAAIKAAVESDAQSSPQSDAQSDAQSSPQADRHAGSGPP